MIVITVERSDPLLKKVKVLARANSATLGFLPDGAFDESANRRLVLAAVDTEERLLGYLLYRLTGLKAVLTHLCVEPHARKCGVATALFGELVERTKHLQGISAATRREFQANKVWPKFGFAAVGEKLGRGRDPKILTIWWFQHQHPTLFSFAANNQQGKQPMDVVIDLNVFYDFYFERANSRESQALVADWLDGEIRLCVTAEHYNEINRLESGLERERQKVWVGDFHMLSGTRDDFTSALSRI